MTSVLSRFAIVSSYARRLFKHFNPRSLWIIRLTEDRWIPIWREIWRTVRCDFGTPHGWVPARQHPVSMFSVERAERGRPLPGRRSAVPVSRRRFSRRLMLRNFHCFAGNYLISLFAPQPFASYKFFIRIRSSVINTMLKLNIKSLWTCRLLRCKQNIKLVPVFLQIDYCWISKYNIQFWICAPKRIKIGKGLVTLLQKEKRVPLFWRHSSIYVTNFRAGKAVV